MTKPSASDRHGASRQTVRHPESAVPGQPHRSRRAVLRAGLFGAGGLVAAGGVTAGLIETGLLPGRDRLTSLLHRGGPVGPSRSGSFVSAARNGARTYWKASWPHGCQPGQPLPLLVSLHGYNADHRNTFTELRFDEVQTQLVEAGTAPFVVASVDGGNGYWHARAALGDSGAMVTDEFVPMLARYGVTTRRYGLYGWSMGGYGALLLGERLGPSAVPAVIASSPALWTSAARRQPLAFDGEADYEANNVWTGRPGLAKTAMRIDCGTSDGFCPAVEQFVAGCSPRPAGGFTAGGHDTTFWRKVAPAQLAFAARTLHQTG